MICIMAGILIAVALYSVNRQKSFMESCTKELKNSLIQAQEVKCDLEEMMLNTINLSKELVDDLERKMKIEVEPQFAAKTEANSEAHVIITGPKLTELQCQIGEAPVKESTNGTVSSTQPRFPQEKVAGPKLFGKPAGEAVESIPVALYNSKLPVSEKDVNLLLEPQLNISRASVGIRVHELADELKTSSKELLSVCRQIGLGINHHMNILTTDQIARIKAQWFFGEQPRIPDQSPITFQPEIVSVTTPLPERLTINTSRNDRAKHFSLEEIKQAHPYLAVRTLSEQGYDQKEIARILGRGQSEISLILNLTRRKQASNA